MRIRRSQLARDFLKIPNATVRDDRLSYMARGILCELLSRPDGWEATADSVWRASVARHGKASPGRRAFRAAFAELKEHGYLVAEREQLPGGKHATTLIAYDVSPGRTDVPHGGTSDASRIGIPPGRTDVPHGGTSDASDVPGGGTSAPPGETAVFAGRTDVPPTDVPPCGTSKEEDGSKKTGEASKQERRPADDLDFGIPAAARPLIDGITASGFIVRWPFKGNEWFPLLSLISKSGVTAMVEHAVKAASRTQVDSAKYFMSGWGELPPLPRPSASRPQLRAVSGSYQPYKQPDASAYQNDLGF